MKIIVTVLVLLIKTDAFAITEKQIIDSVIDNFELIQEEALKFEASKAEIEENEGAFDHKLNFKTRNRIEDKYNNQYFETSLERLTPFYGMELVAGHRQGRGTFPAYDGKNMTSGMGEIFAGLSIPLLRNFSTDEARTNLEVAKINKEQAKAKLELKKNMYVHKALSLYYKWLLEKKKIQIRREILSITEERHQMLIKRYQAGAVEKIKINDNQRSIDKRKDELIKNEIDLAKIKAELTLYLKNKDGTPIPLPEEISIEENLILKQLPLGRPTLADVPQLKILHMERKKLESQEKFNRQSKLPGVRLELLGARELSGNPAYDPDSLQVGLKFDYPLENRKAEGKTEGIKMKISALDRQMRYLDQEISRFYDFSWSAMHDSKKRWDVVNSELQNAEQVAKAEKMRWEQGASDLFIVFLREQDVADTNIRRWTTLYEYVQYSLDAKLFSATLF